MWNGQPTVPADEKIWLPQVTMSSLTPTFPLFPVVSWPHCARNQFGAYCIKAVMFNWCSMAHWYVAKSLQVFGHWLKIAERLFWVLWLCSNEICRRRKRVNLLLDSCPQNKSCRTRKNLLEDGSDSRKGKDHCVAWEKTAENACMNVMYSTKYQSICLASTSNQPILWGTWASVNIQHLLCFMKLFKSICFWSSGGVFKGLQMSNVQKLSRPNRNAYSIKHTQCVPKQLVFPW